MATAAAAGPVHGPFGMGLTPWTYERLVREVLIDQDTTIVVQGCGVAGTQHDMPRLWGRHEVGGHD